MILAAVAIASFAAIVLGSLVFADRVDVRRLRSERGQQPDAALLPEARERALSYWRKRANEAISTDERSKAAARVRELEDGR